AKPSAMYTNNKLNKTNDNISEKCPLCYMIFPLIMTIHDRHEHVQDHYNDD
ncbi:unnamed protein product, partial [Adineta steineri]